MIPVTIPPVSIQDHSNPQLTVTPTTVPWVLQSASMTSPWISQTPAVSTWLDEKKDQKSTGVGIGSPKASLRNRSRSPSRKPSENKRSRSRSRSPSRSIHNVPGSMSIHTMPTEPVPGMQPILKTNEFIASYGIQPPMVGLHWLPYGNEGMNSVPLHAGSLYRPYENSRQTLPFGPHRYPSAQECRQFVSLSICCTFCLFIRCMCVTRNVRENAAMGINVSTDIRLLCVVFGSFLK